MVAVDDIKRVVDSLKKDEHYTEGKWGGRGKVQKNLLKPGALYVMAQLNLWPGLELGTCTPDTPDVATHTYNVICTLRDEQGVAVSCGVGAGNPCETMSKEPDNQPATWDQVNRAIKMAGKRAIVDAVMNLIGWYFRGTQDMEDYEKVLNQANRPGQRAGTATRPPQEPQRQKQPSAPPPNGNGDSQNMGTLENIIISRTHTKSGNKQDGGTWRRVAFCHEDEWYATINDQMGDAVLKAEEDGVPTTVKWEAGQYGREIKTVVFEGDAPHQDDVPSHGEIQTLEGTVITNVGPTSSHPDWYKIFANGQDFYGQGHDLGTQAQSAKDMNWRVNIDWFMHPKNKRIVTKIAQAASDPPDFDFDEQAQATADTPF